LPEFIDSDWVKEVTIRPCLGEFWIDWVIDDSKEPIKVNPNLDRVQRKRNNQMRDAINKAARFIINRCLADGIGNLVIGWNEGFKNSPKMGKRGNQNFMPIPTGRLIVFQSETIIPREM